MLDKIKEKRLSWWQQRCRWDECTFNWWVIYTKFDKAVEVIDSLNVVKLDHYVFDCLSGWKESVSLNILQFN